MTANLVLVDEKEIALTWTGAEVVFFSTGTNIHSH